MPTFGFGAQAPAKPPTRLPGTIGMIGFNGNIGNLPGSKSYSDQYAAWMKTPEAQATLHQSAVDQAKVSNALNPYSQGYNAPAANAMKAAAGGDYMNGDFREAMGIATSTDPTGAITGTDPFQAPALGTHVRGGRATTPAPMPMTTGGGGGRPPAPDPTPMPLTPPGGVNAWQAARSLRRPSRKPPVIGTGPMKPPRPYATA